MSISSRFRSLPDQLGDLGFFKGKLSEEISSLKNIPFPHLSREQFNTRIARLKDSISAFQITISSKLEELTTRKEEIETRIEHLATKAFGWIIACFCRLIHRKELAMCDRLIERAKTLDTQRETLEQNIPKHINFRHTEESIRALFASVQELDGEFSSDESKESFISLLVQEGFESQEEHVLSPEELLAFKRKRREFLEGEIEKERASHHRPQDPNPQSTVPKAQGLPRDALILTPEAVEDLRQMRDNVAGAFRDGVGSLREQAADVVSEIRTGWRQVTGLLRFGRR